MRCPTTSCLLIKTFSQKSADNYLSISTVRFGAGAASAAFVIELTLVPLFFPQMVKDFDLSAQQLSWVVQSYSFCVVVGVLLGGFIADRISLKHVFISGVAMFGIGSWIVAAAHEFDAVIVGRVLQGLGGGIFSPLVPILLTRTDKVAPGRALMLWGSVLGLIAAITPAVYSVVFREFGWSAAFSFFVLLAATSIALIGWTKSSEEVVANRLALSKSVITSKNLFLMYGYVFCTYGAISYYLFRLPLLADQQAIDLSKIGFLLSVFWLTFSVVGALLRRVVDTPHVKQVLLLAPVFIGLGCFALFSATGTPLMSLSAILLGVGLACSNAPSTQMILEFAPKQASGVSASLDITFARLGTVTTVAFLAGASAFLSLAAIACLCGLAFLAILFVRQQAFPKQ